MHYLVYDVHYLVQSQTIIHRYLRFMLTKWSPNPQDPSDNLSIYLFQSLGMDQSVCPPVVDVLLYFGIFSLDDQADAYLI